MSPTTGTTRAWTWVEHLRSGGTTTWREWSQPSEVLGATGSTRSGPVLPGAQQLELLRRLNDAGRPPASLVDRVLSASAPGRGTPDLELRGASSESSFGPRPVDPTDLPDHEVARVASGLVAEDLVAIGPRPAPAVSFARLRGVLAAPYRLVGDPWVAPQVRAELIRHGRRPGGTDPTVYVLGGDLASLIAHVWTARCFGYGAIGWRSWLDPLVAADRLPPRADLARIAARWGGAAGRVEVVLEADRLPHRMTRRGFPHACSPRVPELGADAVEAARRVGATLGLLVLPDARARLLRTTLLPRLVGSPGRPLGIPTEHREWVRRRAAGLRDRLREGHYVVHGDPETLLDAGPQEAGAPDDAGVLEVLVGLLLEGPAMSAGETVP